MSTSSESRRNRRKRRSSAPKVIMILIVMVIMLGAGAFVGKEYLAKDRKAVISDFYEERYQQANEMADDSNYSGAIRILQSIGEDWDSYDKVERKISEYQEAYREDLFEQLDTLQYQAQVQGTGNEDQIRLLTDAAPYLSGDSQYEKKLLEVCGITVEDDGTDTTEADGADTGGDDNTETTQAEGTDTRQNKGTDTPQAGGTSPAAKDDQTYDFDVPASGQ